MRDDNCSFTVLIKDMENVATDWNKSFFVQDDWILVIWIEFYFSVLVFLVV